MIDKLIEGFLGAMLAIAVFMLLGLIVFLIHVTAVEMGLVWFTVFNTAASVIGFILLVIAGRLIWR